MDSVRVKIELTQGKCAYVDPEDAAKLSFRKWHASKSNTQWYAKSDKGTRKNRQRLRMHRVIMGAKPGEQIDHINGDGLNNCKSNLRRCTHQENHFNEGLSKNNTSGYKGVSWCKRDKKWIAQIAPHGKNKYLGRFDCKHEAAEAYNEAAKKHFGEFARLNVIVHK